MFPSLTVPGASHDKREAKAWPRTGLRAALLVIRAGRWGGLVAMHASVVYERVVHVLYILMCCVSVWCTCCLSELVCVHSHARTDTCTRVCAHTHMRAHIHKHPARGARATRALIQASPRMYLHMPTSTVNKSMCRYSIEYWYICI
jgi:hypothetical protein